MRLLHRSEHNGAHAESDVARPLGNVLASNRWELSRALATAGLTILCLFVLLLLIGGQIPVKEFVATVIPAPVRDYFQSDEVKPPVVDEEQQPQILQKLKTVLPEKRATKAGKAATTHSAHISLGITKNEVRSIQGQPTRATDNIWFYGPSEVYFIQGRVVGWSNSERSPLKVP